MKRIVILGGGESGVGAAVLAKQKGYDVFLSDKSKIADKYRRMLNDYSIAWEERVHTESEILNADEVIKSPGIPEDTPLIKALYEKQISVISEIEFAGRYTDAKMICVTGSNGKTTTTLLVYHTLKESGINVGLAGNVGKSLAYQVATESYDCYVVELSSFQLDGMVKFKVDIAILLNITPDHLDRYDYNFDNYAESKLRITQNQTSKEFFIYNVDDPTIRQKIENRKIEATLYPFSMDKKRNSKAFIEDHKLIIHTLKRHFTMDTSLLSLKGKHNMYNAMATGLTATIMDIRKESIRKSLGNFSGVEHRLEYVATIRNVKYVNDSKATNVNSCWYALESVDTPIVLILGGTDKGNDYSEIEELIKEKVHTLIFLGKDNTKLHTFFDDKGINMIDVHSMEDAVTQAHIVAKEFDTILLSPCCASFDLFQHYEDRGNQFKKYVKAL